MNKPNKTIMFKTIMLLVLPLALAACASGGSQRVDSSGSEQEPIDQGGSDRPVVVAPGGDQGQNDPYGHLNPTDHSDPRNIDNPNSLLFQRIIYFDFDQSTVRNEYRPVIAAHAELLASNPNMSVVLEGHADERGTREYNLGLGERRGNTASRAIDAGGASGGQINVVSYGEERPVMTCSDEGCWSQNRRVEIIYR